MREIKQYITIATFLVVVVTAAYLEFPMVTALILVIIIVIYLATRNSSDKPNFLSGRNFSFAPERTSAQIIAPYLNKHRTRSKGSNRASLLTGLAGFCLTVRGRTSWRYPFLLRNAANLTKAILDGQELRAAKEDLWLTNSDYAQLTIDILVEQIGQEIRLTAQLEVIGKVEITRSNASIKEASSLWKSTMTRITAASQISFDMEDAIISGLSQLLADYFTSTYRNADVYSRRLPPGT